MTRGRTFAAAACLLALLVSGCTDGDGGDSGPSDGSSSPALEVVDQAIGQTLEVSTVSVVSGEESTTTVTVLEVERYTAGDSVEAYGDDGVAVLLRIETTDDDAGPTVRAVDQDDVELNDDRLSEDRPNDPSFVDIWQDRRSAETSSDDPGLEESYEGWVTYVFDGASTKAVDLRVEGDLDDEKQVTVLGDAEAPEAEQQQLDETAEGEDTSAGDFVMKVIEVVDPATDLPPTIQPGSGERVVGLRLQITLIADNDLPPAVDLYVDDVRQVAVGSDPFLEPFQVGETRTEWRYFTVPNRDLPTEVELRSLDQASDSVQGRIELQ